MLRKRTLTTVRPFLHQSHLFLASPSCRYYSRDSAKRIVASSKVLQFGKRFIQYTFYSSLFLVVATAVGFEGTHLWVEKVELAPEKDPEVKRWEWDQEVKWSGDSVTGGTDPALGYYGRHWVRAAWAASNWGEYRAAVVASPEIDLTHAPPAPQDLKLVEANATATDSFIRGALRVASQSDLESLHPETVAQLLTRHASVLERLSGKALQESRTEYERAWAEFSGKGLDAASVAVRLGEINAQLDRPDDAVFWWAQAVNLTLGEAPKDLKTLPTVLKALPPSPRAQRILSTTLVSLSSFYAKSGELLAAQALEETALMLFRPIFPPTSVTLTPSHTLHDLYLLHRSSLLSIHLGEVLSARKKPLALSIECLTSAAQSSQKVAHTLAGTLSLGNPGASSPIKDVSPLATYTDSRSMKKPAEALLRDARRTSAEAWNLLGILNETQGKNLPAAMRCYERAVQWASSDRISNDMKPHEGMLASEWASIWNNYSRAKRNMEKNTSQASLK